MRSCCITSVRKPINGVERCRGKLIQQQRTEPGNYWIGALLEFYNNLEPNMNYLDVGMAERVLE
jgi:hypothetical protein